MPPPQYCSIPVAGHRLHLRKPSVHSLVLVDSAVLRLPHLPYQGRAQQQRNRPSGSPTQGLQPRLSPNLLKTSHLPLRQAHFLQLLLRVPRLTKEVVSTERNWQVEVASLSVLFLMLLGSPQPFVDWGWAGPPARRGPKPLPAGLRKPRPGQVLPHPDGQDRSCCIPSFLLAS